MEGLLVIKNIEICSILQTGTTSPLGVRLFWFFLLNNVKSHEILKNKHCAKGVWFSFTLSFVVSVCPFKGIPPWVWKQWACPSDLQAFVSLAHLGIFDIFIVSAEINVYWWFKVPVFLAHMVPGYAKSRIIFQWRGLRQSFFFIKYILYSLFPCFNFSPNTLKSSENQDFSLRTIKLLVAWLC